VIEWNEEKELDTAYLKDTSRNGLWVNGKRVRREKEPRMLLHHGDLVSLTHPILNTPESPCVGTFSLFSI
jgi:pSer/pThr/pTyr-binding forkhead associated (FHA) protein